MLGLFLLTVFSLIHCCNSKDIVTVNTLYGEVNGFTHEYENNKIANVFLGVPFAEPPLGELRFEVPSFLFSVDVFARPERSVL